MNEKASIPLPDNRRGFTRVHSEVDAVLLTAPDKRPIASGRVLDISMNGIYLVCNADLEEGSACWLRIPLQPGSPAPAITVAATVARRDSGGFALRFDEISLESYELLRNLVLYNASVVVEVEQELVRQRGIHPRAAAPASKTDTAGKRYP